MNLRGSLLQIQLHEKDFVPDDFLADDVVVNWRYVEGGRDQPKLRKTEIMKIICSKNNSTKNSIGHGSIF